LTSANNFISPGVYKENFFFLSLFFSLYLPLRFFFLDSFSQNEQNSYHQPDYHSQQQQQHHPQALMPGVSHYHIPTTSSKSTEASPQR
jgi:hypothetical protein